jgi:hypothetical protein
MSTSCPPLNGPHAPSCPPINRLHAPSCRPLNGPHAPSSPTYHLAWASLRTPCSIHSTVFNHFLLYAALLSILSPFCNYSSGLHLTFMTALWSLQLKMKHQSSSHHCLAPILCRHSTRRLYTVQFFHCLTLSSLFSFGYHSLATATNVRSLNQWMQSATTAQPLLQQSTSAKPTQPLLQPPSIYYNCPTSATTATALL